MAQIIAESQYDESILRGFRERFWNGGRTATRALIERGIREGDLREDTDPEVIAELVYSAVYVRLLFRYRTLDRKFAESIVAAAFAGIAARSAVQPQAPAARTRLLAVARRKRCRTAPPRRSLTSA